MESLQERFQNELDQVTWADLARPFAFRRLWCVSDTANIVEVATKMVEDQASDLARWLQSGDLRLADDQDAAGWAEDPELHFHILIVRPYVLVKPVSRS